MQNDMKNHKNLTNTLYVVQAKEGKRYTTCTCEKEVAKNGYNKA